MRNLRAFVVTLKVSIAPTMWTAIKNAMNLKGVIKMREILYRGKPISGKAYSRRWRTYSKWTYGSLIVHSGEYIIKEYSSDMSHGANTVKVFPETVGQYTGLDDKNGIKIFEGAIVLIDEGCDIVGMYMVIFEQKKARFAIRSLSAASDKIPMSLTEDVAKRCEVASDM